MQTFPSNPNLPKEHGKRIEVQTEASATQTEAVLAGSSVPAPCQIRLQALEGSREPAGSLALLGKGKRLGCSWDEGRGKPPGPQEGRPGTQPDPDGGFQRNLRLRRSVLKLGLQQGCRTDW